MRSRPSTAATLRPWHQERIRRRLHNTQQRAKEKVMLGWLECIHLSVIDMNQLESDGRYMSRYFQTSKTINKPTKSPRLIPDTPTKSLHAIPPRDFLMVLGRTQLPVRRPMQPNAGAPASNGVSLTKSDSDHHPPQIPRSVLVDERQIAISCAGRRH